MAQLPSALANQSSRQARTSSPVRCTAKSIIVVVPPQAAALVPVSNVSEAKVPPNGSSIWVCTSMPPGTTYLPAALMTVSAVMPLVAPALASLVPLLASALVSPELGCSRAAIRSPSTSTSNSCDPCGVMTVPLVISVRICLAPVLLALAPVNF